MANTPVLVAGTITGATDSPRIRTAAPGSFFAAGAAAIGTKLYLVGGYGNANNLYEWDQSTNLWTAKAPMPVSLYNMGVAVIGTKLYVVGGTDGTNKQATLYEWDQASNTWSTKASIPAGLNNVGAAAIGTKVYAEGSNNGVTAELYEWDQASNAWSKRATMPIHRDFGGVAAIGSKLYVEGGYGYNGLGPVLPTSTIYEWDPAFDTWSVKALLPDSRNSVAAAVIGTKLYAIGGQNNLAISTGTLFEWDNTQILRVLVDGATVDSVAVTLNGAVYPLGARVIVALRNPQLPTIQGLATY